MFTHTHSSHWHIKHNSKTCTQTKTLVMGLQSLWDRIYTALGGLFLQEQSAIYTLFYKFSLGFPRDVPDSVYLCEFQSISIWVSCEDRWPTRATECIAESCKQTSSS